MMDEAGIRVQLAMPCLIISAIFFSLSGRLRYKIGGMLLALTSIYIGFRSYFACYAVVMAIIIYNARFETIKLKSSWKFLFYIIPVFIFVVLSKRIYAGLKMDVGVTNIFEGGLIEAFVKGSEFFSTQYIYQSIINNEYSLEIKNYILSFLALLPIPQSLWGGGSSYFNKAFQADLFSDVSYGMAYNPWAEAYAYGNIFGVIIFVVFYCYFLFCMQWLHIKFRYTVLPVLMSILLFYHGFYFHRNSLAVEFSFIRNYSYLFLLGCFFYGGGFYISRERGRDES
ncbi:hypothetical protein A3Q32_19295 [Alcanivorax sp. KX64203]|nr:hypothetical protein A3Q32_19295 [Alcanivorax sp. KX64203]